jgi:hypothetical protein
VEVAYLLEADISGVVQNILGSNHGLTSTHCGCLCYPGDLEWA